MSKNKLKILKKHHDSIQGPPYQRYFSTDDALGKVINTLILEIKDLDKRIRKIETMPVIV